MLSTVRCRPKNIRICVARTPPIHCSPKTSGTANGAPGTMTVRGQAPMSELLGYQSRLNALTSGQGRYTVEFSHYEAVPPNTQQRLIGEFKVRDDD